LRTSGWLDVIIQPGRGHSFHKHPNQEEIIRVLDGEIEQWMRDERSAITTGDTASIPRDTVALPSLRNRRRRRFGFS
jgi:quercetin dioxygenase-like cupin family protein